MLHSYYKKKILFVKWLWRSWREKQDPGASGFEEHLHEWLALFLLIPNINTRIMLPKVVKLLTKRRNTQKKWLLFMLLTWEVFFFENPCPPKIFESLSQPRPILSASLSIMYHLNFIIHFIFIFYIIIFYLLFQDKILKRH